MVFGVDARETRQRRAATENGRGGRRDGEGQFITRFLVALFAKPKGHRGRTIGEWGPPRACERERAGTRRLGGPLGHDRVHESRIFRVFRQAVSRVTMGKIEGLRGPINIAN